MALQSHAPKVLAAIATIGAISAVGYAVYRWWRERKSQPAYLPTANSPEELVTDIASESSEALLLKKEHLDSEQRSKGLSQTRLSQMASDYRKLGNRFFASQNFDLAVDCYTKALSVSPTNDVDAALAFCNRAACHAKFGHYQEMLQDCNEAIRLNGNYTKAFDRRHKAYEALGQFFEAATDLMITCVLENFKNERNTKLLDAMILRLAEQETEEVLKRRSPQLPSNLVIREFINSFPSPLRSAEASAFPASLLSAVRDLEGGRYAEAYSQFVQLLYKDSILASHALISYCNEMVGTFEVLEGKIPDAQRHLNTAIEKNPRNVNARVKLAVAFLEQANFSRMMEIVNEAISLSDKDDPTAWFHRGEFYAMSNDFSAAVADYDHAISLQRSFSIAHVHKARSLLAAERVEEARAFVVEALREFPRNSDLLNCYGEILAFCEQPDEAIARFTDAISISPTNASFYLNRAIILLSVKGDVEGATENLTSAIRNDPKYESAYLQLGNVLLSKGEVSAAFDQYELAARYARNREELMAVMQVRESSRVQINVGKINPEFTGKFLSVISNLYQQPSDSAL